MPPPVNPPTHVIFITTTLARAANGKYDCVFLEGAKEFLNGRKFSAVMADFPSMVFKDVTHKDGYLPSSVRVEGCAHVVLIMTKTNLRFKNFQSAAKPRNKEAPFGDFLKHSDDGSIMAGGYGHSAIVSFVFDGIACPKDANGGFEEHLDLFVEIPPPNFAAKAASWVMNAVGLRSPDEVDPDVRYPGGTDP